LGRSLSAADLRDDSVMKLASLKPRVSKIGLGRAAALIPPRMTGRRLVSRNRDFLATHPLCAACRMKVATEVDHRVPLHLGGLDEESNLQGLCHDCHAEKTTAEQAARLGTTSPQI